jgi:hypothetical protein
MTQEWKFQDKHAFLEKLEELVHGGIPARELSVVMPIPVHEVEHLLHPKPSRLKFFTLVGAIVGLFSGFALTIGTSLDWPLITGGKPIVSLPPYIIIAFELTILFGGILTFVGFLILSRMPDLRAIASGGDPGNDFIIRHEAEVKS